jgi:hypoxanthine phosphoribosyltransferase
MVPNLYSDIERTLINETELYARIQELAQQIEDDYEEEEDLLLIGVLKGAVTFMSALSMLIKRPHEIDFMATSSYGSSTSSSGIVKIIMDLRADIHNRNVLIVEDIIDSGRTLNYLRDLFLARTPASLRICTLLNKPSRREVDVPIDYIGFDIPDEFVVGFGLDFNEIYRNIPFIAVLKPSAFGEG